MNMPGDPIDKRVYCEYLLWFAFTAVPNPYTDPRMKVARRFFQGRGYKT